MTAVTTARLFETLAPVASEHRYPTQPGYQGAAEPGHQHCRHGAVPGAVLVNHQGRRLTAPLGAAVATPRRGRPAGKIEEVLALNDSR